MRPENSWHWVPTLYFAQGLPYVVVMTVAVTMFKRLGISNTEIALYTSWLYLPWVIKPLWSPVVDILKTRRWWIVTMQLLIGAGLAGIALLLPGPEVFRYTLAMMWLLAFSSATHDIAADGFYMLALNEKQQAYFVGIRNTFYRLAVITGQGIIVMFAGYLEYTYIGEQVINPIPQAWSVTFYMLAALFTGLFIFHHFVLPRPKKDIPAIQAGINRRKAFLDTFYDFFTKKEIVSALAFILLFRFAESQLVKIATPFMLDPAGEGGLGLTTTKVGFIYGTVGMIALTVGGIIGGFAMSRNGLKHWIGWMTLAMNLPNAVYLYLSVGQPDSLPVIASCVAIEQFGYGFGFTALTFYMMLFSSGRHQTAHYALCTGFMALGMMLPGMISGWVQELIGYQHFFVWIMLCTIPSFVAARYVRIPENKPPDPSHS